MRICHITSAHNRYDGRIFTKQCNTLVEAGEQVLIICFDGKPDEISNNISIHSYSNHKFSKSERFSLLLRNKGIVEYLLSLNCDIYQFHDIELIEVGRILSKKKKIVIFDSHENWFGYVSELFPNLLRGIVKRLMYLYYKRVLNSFGAVFTVSPNLVTSLSRFSSRVYFIPNYPMLESISEDYYGVRNNFIYQGSVYAISNQVNITKAVNMLPHSAKYNIVGGISDYLKEQIRSVDTHQRVLFTNWVEKKELQKLMASSNAGLVLLDYCPICCDKEGQLGSNKIFEYMAAGLPVICTDFNLWKQLIIDKYNCGIAVNPINVDEIVSAMNKILNNPRMAEIMGENGKRAIREEFNWDIYKPAFVNIYRELYNRNANKNN